MNLGIIVIIASYLILLIFIALVIGFLLYGLSKIRQTQMHLWEKSLCLAFYLLPTLECMSQCGPSVLSNYAWIRTLYRISIKPLVIIYSDYPIIGFLIFLLSYLLFVKGIIKVKKIVRFHVSQALMIYIVNSILGVLMSTMPDSLLMGWFGQMCIDILFILTNGCILYACYKVIQGEWTRIPIISEAAKVQVQDGEGDKR
nr:hypothetical protein [Cyanidioschyzonaceae sp. 1]